LHGENLLSSILLPLLLSQPPLPPPGLGTSPVAGPIAPNDPQDAEVGDEPAERNDPHGAAAASANLVTAEPPTPAGSLWPPLRMRPGGVGEGVSSLHVVPATFPPLPAPEADLPQIVLQWLVSQSPGGKGVFPSSQELSSPPP
jgi:hypothetical protein